MAPWRARRVWRALAARWRAGAALAALALALLVRVPRDATLTASFPHPPQQLAHFLADFSNYPKLYSHIETWKIEEESNDNMLTWRYVVSYTCGPRCEGRASLSHRTRPPPPAGQGDARQGDARQGDARKAAAREADTHSLRVVDKRCIRLPLLYWPQFCDESEVESEITGAVGAGGAGGGGSRVEERARVWCGAVRALALGCDARPLRERFLRALRDAL